MTNRPARRRPGPRRRRAGSGVAPAAPTIGGDAALARLRGDVVEGAAGLDDQRERRQQRQLGGEQRARDQHLRPDHARPAPFAVQTDPPDPRPRGRRRAADDVARAEGRRCAAQGRGARGPFARRQFDAEAAGRSQPRRPGPPRRSPAPRRRSSAARRRARRARTISSGNQKTSSASASTSAARSRSPSRSSARRT